MKKNKQLDLNKIQKKLLAYSAVAGVAAIGATSADASIIYTDLGAGTVLNGSSFTLDLNNDGNDDITIIAGTTTDIPASWGDTATYGMLGLYNGAAVVGAQLTSTDDGIYAAAANLINENISAGNNFTTSSDVYLFAIYDGVNYPFGNWSPGDTKEYVGFRVVDSTSGNTHYGWIELSISGDAKTYTVTGYAYEDVAGAAIQAGDAPLTNTIVLTGLSCNGDSGGVLTSNVVKGTPPYTYAWNTTDSTQSISGIAFGATYTVTATDSLGVTAIDSITTTEPAVLVATIDSTISESCESANGEVAITVTGGTTAYTYSWSNALTTQTASGLSAGSYTVTVTDANNCTATSDTSIVNTSLAVNATTAIVSPTCFGDTDGEATVTATDGTGSFSYSWSNASTDQALSGLPADTYTVTVTDANNCTVTNEASLVSGAAIDLSIATTAATCIECEDGTITVTATGGAGSFAYLWDDDGSSTSAAVTGLEGGEYCVTATDLDGCSADTCGTVDKIDGITDWSNTSLNAYSFNNTIFINNAQIGEVVIYNMSGEVVHQSMLSNGNNAIALDVDGVVVISITNEGQQYIKKVVL